MFPSNPNSWNRHSSGRPGSITRQNENRQYSQDIFIMTLEVKVPVLPESVSDATIASWHKKPGDAVKRDENLVDLETDKVVLEVPSPVAGVIKEIKLGNGATVKGGQLLALI